MNFYIILYIGVLVKLVMPQNVGTAMWLMPVVYWKDAAIYIYNSQQLDIAIRRMCVSTQNTQK